MTQRISTPMQALRTSACLLIAIFIGLFSPAGFAAEKPLEVICPNNDYPFIYADSNGRPKGFLVDYFQAFSDATKRPLQITLAAPEDLPLLFQHKGDILFDANHHNTLPFKAIETRPFMVLENALVVLQHSFSPADSLSSIKRQSPLTLGIKDNDDRFSLLVGRAHHTTQILRYSNNSEGLDALRVGRIDGFFMPSIQAIKLINETQMRNLTLIKDLNYSETYLFKTKDPLIAAELNNFITAYNRSDAYSKAYKHAFGATYLEDFFKNYFIYIFNAVTILALLCVMLLAFVISRSQRKTIASKDQELRRQMENNKYLLDTVLSHEKNLNDYYVNLSHEFRTPLNMILSVAQATEVLTKTMNTKKLVQNNSTYNRIIKTNAFRMMKLINNITDLKKLDQNLYALRYETLDLLYLAEEMTEQVQVYLGRSDISIQLHCPHSEILMVSDPIVLKRILANLISNAIKHGRLTSQITLSLDLRDEFVILSLSDNGIGIATDAMENIFDSYAKVKSEVTAFYEQEGAGIGLTLVKRFVELMEGTIAIDSTSGKGTTLTIVLPTQPAVRSFAQPERQRSGVLHSEQIIEIELSDVWTSELIG